jgi:hypothetical protein
LFPILPALSIDGAGSDTFADRHCWRGKTEAVNTFRFTLDYSEMEENAMKKLKSLIVVLALVVIGTSWMPVSVASSQAAFYAASSPVAGPWYVVISGNDSNTCLTPANPCATINAAIGKASPGDTLLVAVGTYKGEGTEVVRIDKDVTLSGGWDSSFITQDSTSTIDGRESMVGIYVVDGVTATIDRFLIRRGLGRNDLPSGGIYVNQASLTVNNSVVTECAPSFAGSIGVFGYQSGNEGQLIINNSLITNNASRGIWNWGIMTINNSSISENQGDYGAGIWNVNSLTINNSTISNNHASHVESIGGGILTDGNLILNNTTIVSNTATVGGGGIYNRGTVTIQNTILSGNTGGSSPDCYGTFTTAGYNLLGDPAGCTFTPGTGDLVGVNPDLSPLIGMLGKPQYHPLLSGSPAIDAGNPAGCTGSTGDLLTDQRGALRVGVCDIGAYEYTLPGAPSTVFAYSGSDQYASPGSPFAQPLVATVLDGLGSPVDGITVTFSAPAAGASGTFADTSSITTTALTTSSSLATAAILTANEITGSYVVTASVSGEIEPAQFKVSNATGDLYVSPLGDDSDTCLEPNHPCATLLEAYKKADPGKTILIVQGVYTDTAPNILKISKDIIVSGGWDGNFSMQAGSSTLDGEGVRNGILVDSGVSVVLERVDVEHATAQPGDSQYGIYNDSTLTMTLVTIREITGWGVINNSNLRIVSSIIQENTEGGIRNSGTVTLFNSAVIKNSVENSTWGGISNGASGILNINNSTISFNSNRYGYGGISSDGALSLNSSTVSYNTGLGIRAATGSQVLLKNSIVAENHSFDNDNQDCEGNITSAGYNLIGDTTGCSFTSGTGDLQNVGAGLPPFIGKSGVQPIQSNSPAVDAGNPSGCTDHEGNLLDADQRGIARFGRCDIGAYEYDPASDPIRTISIPIVYQDLCYDFFDFNDNANGWFVGEDDDLLAEQLDGEYRVVVKPKDTTYLLGSPSCPELNYVVEVDARWGGNSGSSYGLIFGIEGNYDRFYSFEVNSDFQEFALYRYEFGSWSEAIPWSHSGAILPGKQTNHLKVTHSEGPIITLEVNGTYLTGYGTNYEIGFTATGLTVNSYTDVSNADARFDNFRLTRLQPTITTLERTAQEQVGSGYGASWAQKDNRRKVTSNDNRR